VVASLQFKIDDRAGQKHRRQLTKVRNRPLCPTRAGTKN
jgi:hypothetical protein